MIDIFWKHQVAIAKKTINMPDAVLDYLNTCSPYGGMTKERAREILKKDAEIKKKPKGRK